MLGVFGVSKTVRAADCLVPFSYNPIPNSVFNNYESTEYQNGFLVVHFQLNRQLTLGEQWYPRFIYVDDQCRTRDQVGAGSLLNPTPVALRNVSLRFSSAFNWQFWDDDTNTALTCNNCSGSLYPVGQFFKIRLHLVAGYGGTLLGEFTSSAEFPVQTPAPPPIKTDTIASVPGCPPLSVTGGMVDAYEHAEYVGGYLRVHFRRNPFENNGRLRFQMRQYDPNCSSSTQAYQNELYFYYFPEYFSLRFIDATHFQIWDDDRELNMDCIFSCFSPTIQINDGSQPMAIFLQGYTPLDVLDPANKFTSSVFPIKEPGRDPVIIIPGILGSWTKNGQLVIDPVLHTYDDLIETLEANGYTMGTDLFTMPYEWRNSNIISAQALRDKINEVQAICNCAKVDLVAHSMGGLVARQYIQSVDYEGDVDQLIFLGTPHLGGPSAYAAWEAGTTLPGIQNFILDLIMRDEAKENGFKSAYEYIKNRPISSLNELLPVYDYLRDKSTGIVRSYPNNYPTNSFLENLNGQISSLYSSNVRLSNIIGNTTNQNTVDGFTVIPQPPNLAPLWQHGFPDGFDNILSYRGLERGPGDETVPAGSAGFITQDLSSINARHLDLPSQAEGLVYQQLTGHTATTIIHKDRGSDKKYILIKILSPVDVQIIAPDGKRIGKDFATNQEVNEIPDAFYSGFIGDDEYITIPNPLDGEYKVETQGTGTGEYTVASGFITASTSAEQDFTGNTVPGATNELDLTINNAQPEQIVVVPADTTPPSITITSPVATGTYPRSATLNIATIVTDDSGVAQTLRFFDGVPASPTFDPFFSKLGAHTVRIQATDTVNNTASKSVGFTIIATFDSSISDTSRAFTLAWIKTTRVRDTIIKDFQTARDNARKRTSMLATLSSYLDTQYNKKALTKQAYDLLKEDVGWLQTH